MSRHREIKSSEPITWDILVDEEYWRWYETSVTPESEGFFINKFIVSPNRRIASDMEDEEK